MSSSSSADEAEGENALLRRTGFESLEALFSWVDSKVHAGAKFHQVADVLGYNPKYLSHVLRKAGWKGKFVRTNVPGAVEIILRVPFDRYGATWGIVNVQSFLARRGFRISREVLMRALQSLDPERAARRRSRAVKRRVYDVYEPMQLWHMDSYDKMVDYGFRVHGIIDGGSHYVVMCHVSRNKLAKTIFNAYTNDIRLFGRPMSIGSDFASEHVLVELDMLVAHPGRGNAFMKGKSTRNQRIERFWGNLFQGVFWYYKYMANLLEDIGLLDVSNPWHRESLVAAWMPAIEEAVSTFVETWNWHPVRASRERPTHVPVLEFQPHERERNLIPPLTSKEIDTIEDTEDDEDEVKLPQEHLRVRDAAFQANKEGLMEDVLFLLHLDLTLECAAANQLGRTLEQHVAQVLSGSDAHRRKIVALLSACM